ncbi:winged helix-turn-helix domain-containing protein [Vibrio neonatus]|uniref:winged helix-turn-helix domain-containing protein n=1 Tax=Vibrio neonatus TaxID=278860 RepID=UPI0021C304E7|nr:crosslink repair DNA glycosylase YcaQ family protein [Vibrio neonatus]
METLSLHQAQKLALLSQGLLAQPLVGNAYSKSVQVAERLSYIQIDTISVVQRAHHHVLWSRNSDYQLDNLQQMVKEKIVFEYWSHAASYLAMKDYRFTLPRKLAIKSGKHTHWFKKSPQIMSEVLARIKDEGPSMAKDFQSNCNKHTGWESKPTKQALENLYMQGDLMITERKNFHKVYDLTERVLPTHIDTSIPTSKEHARFLILNFLKAHGIGQLKEITYLLKGVQKEVSKALVELKEEGLIVEVLVKNERYFTTSSSLELLNNKLKRKQAKILSPFDNLVIQRARAKHLFDFAYTLECYTPATKRQFGYFCLPVLWDGRLVARVDCKINKATSTLNVINLFIEPSLKRHDEFMEAFNAELIRFATFNNVEPDMSYPIHRLK